MKTQGKEFKVIIKKNGHILYNGDLIAILGQWNKYDDIDLPTKRRVK